MTRFTARAFRRRISKKSKKTRTRTRNRRTRRSQKGGGNTFSREIPKEAVKANPVEWDD